ncbi:MAG: aminopeptidase [Gammaproteobacteria bacterium]
MPHHRWRVWLSLSLAACNSGCATMAYYSQAVTGHVRVMAAVEPISRVTADPNTPAALRDRLTTIERVRRFATEHLYLPENGSYRSYANIGRDFVVWNVFVAPEFSLQPVKSCFPFAGCVNYRGYFNERSARASAERLRAQGNDVYVGGVVAYSTLGWFDDPVLNTMLRWNKLRLARLIFHELAHQKLYIKHDSPFNEAFATLVERVGAERWLRFEGDKRARVAFEREQAREAEFIAIALDTRAKLASIYASDLDVHGMRKAKSTAFDEMREGYRRFRASWSGYQGYDEWMAEDLNNAKFASLVTYHEHATAFETLFKKAGTNLPRFYEIAREVGQLNAQQRLHCLQGLARHGDRYLSDCLSGN